jgi:hypothetical protein
VLHGRPEYYRDTMTVAEKVCRSFQGCWPTTKPWSLPRVAADRARIVVVRGPVKGRYAPLRRVPVASGHSVRLARISDTLAGAGLVLAAPTGFRTLRRHPVLAAARKPFGTTMPCAIIPQQCEK